MLEPFAGESPYDNGGQRVVEGQRLMQAAGDMLLLGWVRLKGPDGETVDFYVRQLWDNKGVFDLSDAIPEGLRIFGEACGWTLARAHARSGDPAAIAGYLGPGDNFDCALGEFAEHYADQTERDHAALLHAIASGRVAAMADPKA